MIIPALSHWIPSELGNQSCLEESSAGMGDLLGSPRVAPILKLHKKTAAMVIFFLPIQLYLVTLISCFLARSCMRMLDSLYIHDVFRHELYY